MEVVGSLKERFRVDPPEIKKAIDSLIERDYMERAEGTRDTYNYLVSRFQQPLRTTDLADLPMPRPRLFPKFAQSLPCNTHL